ncbi:MAG: Sapep family Mn(2+)-dependent dipeptidase, partial [Erysipelotrichaceae bacterium]
MEWMKMTKEEQQSFVSDLRGLINVNSVLDTTTAGANAPFGAGVAQALEYMKQMGIAAGFKVKEYDGYALVLECGSGEESVGVLGHLDIVPIGEGWTKDPFGGEVVDGYMFGRGVIDDKGPSIAAFYALKKVKAQLEQMNRRVLLIFGGDEESGMSCMDHYAKVGEIPTMGFVPDADFPAVYGEKGILRLKLKTNQKNAIVSMHAGTRPNIVIGKANALVAEWNESLQTQFDFYLETNQLEGHVEVGSEGTRLFMDGVFSHAAWPYNGVNAGIHLMNFIGCGYHDALLKGLAQMLKDWRGSGAGMAFEGAYMGFLTMNPGIIHVEDDHIEITLDIRYPNDTDVDAIVGGLQAKLESNHLAVEV